MALDVVSVAEVSTAEEFEDVFRVVVVKFNSTTWTGVSKTNA